MAGPYSCARVFSFPVFREEAVVKLHILFLVCLQAFFCLPQVRAEAAGLKVWLDPGHSPATRGARSVSGQWEHVYNDRLAARVQRRLQKEGIAASLAREPGGELSLMARARKSAGGSLFLSIHHDAAQPQFVELVNGNPYSLKARGYSLFVSKKNPEYARSLEFARFLGNELYNAGFRPSSHHGEPIRGENRKVIDAKLGIYEFDDLVVLKHSAIPAVLVEAGVIIHPEDEALVSTDKFRDDFAGAVARAAREYEKSVPR